MNADKVNEKIKAELEEVKKHLKDIEKKVKAQKNQPKKVERVDDRGKQILND